MLQLLLDTRRVLPSLAMLEVGARGEEIPRSLPSLRRLRPRGCRDPVRHRQLKLQAQRTGSWQEAPDAVSASRQALEAVVTEIEGLLTESLAEPTAKHKELRNQLTHCLERLHAKLQTHEELSETPEGPKRDQQLGALERGLSQIKAEVIDLKRRLRALTTVHPATLTSCLEELDTIAFNDFDCFDAAEKEGLEALYAEFRAVLRGGEDGAVELAKLIYAVKTLKEKRQPSAQAPIAAVEKRTLTRIFDLYATLFPSKEETPPSPTPASTPVSTPTPKAAPPELDTVGGGGSGGGDSGDGGGGDDGGSGSFDSSDEDGIGDWSFILVFGILIAAVSLVLFLPDDKTELRKKLKTAQEWFQRVTGRTPPPPPPPTNDKNKKKKDRG